MSRSSVIRRTLAITIAAAPAWGAWIAGHATPPGAAPATSTLYPSAPAGLRFDHRAHQSTSCVSCHVASATSQRASDVTTPSMSQCVSCHAEDATQPAKPALSACGGCHEGMASEVKGPISTPAQWRAVRPAPMPMRRAQAPLRFDHAAHTSGPFAMQCTSCHALDASSPAPSMPTMAQCRDCHSQALPTVDASRTDCATCHTTRMQARGAALDASAAPTARLQTSLADPTTGLIRRLVPRDHTVDWIARHGPISRSQPAECASCHTESSCAHCHDDKAGGLLSVHPPNFVVLHRVAARGMPNNCNECHKLETTCRECHVRVRAVPDGPGALPPSRTSYHPPGWLDAASPSSHGPMARRNINDCASCHQERDCVSCHQGVNPHDPGFRSRCAQWLRANPEPCAACHTDLGKLQALCR